MNKTQIYDWVSPGKHPYFSKEQLEAKRKKRKKAKLARKKNR